MKLLKYEPLMSNFSQGFQALSVYFFPRFSNEELTTDLHVDEGNVFDRQAHLHFTIA